MLAIRKQHVASTDDQVGILAYESAAWQTSARTFFRDYLPHWEACFREQTNAALSTLGARLALLWRGVGMGPGCQFWGIPCFRRVPGSSISIGASCQFRSSPTANLIGVNHRCIVSTLKRGASIRIGSFCGFSGTVISAEMSVVIGNAVRCGANTVITDTDWHSTDPRAGEVAPVVIEDDVWLGLNVTVLKGVRIGAGTVIGAGSVVTRDIPAGCVAGGNPAKVLRPAIARV